MKSCISSLQSSTSGESCRSSQWCQPLCCPEEEAKQQPFSLGGLVQTPGKTWSCWQTCMVPDFKCGNRLGKPVGLCQASPQSWLLKNCANKYSVLRASTVGPTSAVSAIMDQVLCWEITGFPFVLLFSVLLYGLWKKIRITFSISIYVQCLAPSGPTPYLSRSSMDKTCYVSA